VVSELNILNVVMTSLGSTSRLGRDELGLGVVIVIVNQVAT
jgi:hypothetical protein